ncbi:uncharacterized protein LOC117177598 [Belonocnema kinseyi]|uniref:uncharacterized protein LOC117177598 n=1 Tax=Belonocnema kinseyi TaxID=2817044 RepID=UPI00143D5B27|nr:uncharacterized protein LOC117177598 [Belonocnema kinseyi]
MLVDKPTRERTRPVRSTENIAAVAESVREQPSTSTRHRSQQLAISRTSLMRILRKDLAMKPYKVQLVHQLKPIHHPNRIQFAIWAEDRLIEDDEFYRKIIFSDEAHFHPRWLCQQAKLSHLGYGKSTCHNRYSASNLRKSNNQQKW